MPDAAFARGNHGIAVSDAGTPMAGSPAEVDVMDQTIAELATSLRNAIEAAESSLVHDDRTARALRRAAALLWSALDEIEALEALSESHAS
jgi:hypothetical protein